VVVGFGTAVVGGVVLAEEHEEGGGVVEVGVRGMVVVGGGEGTDVLHHGLDDRGGVGGGGKGR